LARHDQSVLVVAAHTGSVQLSRNPQHTFGVRPTRHQVPDKHYFVVLSRPNKIKQIREFPGAAVNVTYPDRLGHAFKPSARLHGVRMPICARWDLTQVELWDPTLVEL